MSEFTKGPWYVDDNGQDLFVKSLGDVGYICNVGWIRIKKNEANARLIAAAPEMYKTLLEVKNFLEENYNDDMLCYLGIYELLERIDGEEVQE